MKKTKREYNNSHCCGPKPSSGRTMGKMNAETVSQAKLLRMGKSPKVGA